MRFTCAVSYDICARKCAKSSSSSGLVDVEGLDDLRDLRAFDSRYTAPVHGYASADDYWASIAGPFPIRNSHTGSDSQCGTTIRFSGRMLSLEAVRPLDRVYMEVPKSGGHVGISLKGRRLLDGAACSAVFQRSAYDQGQREIMRYDSRSIRSAGGCRAVILKMIVEPFGLAHYPFAGETHTSGMARLRFPVAQPAYFDAVEV